jgi:hypothetical protein
MIVGSVGNDCLGSRLDIEAGAWLPGTITFILPSRQSRLDSQNQRLFTRKTRYATLMILPVFRTFIVEWSLPLTTRSNFQVSE